MPRWRAEALVGRIIRLEPLLPTHAEALWQASRDPRTWRWLSIPQPQDRRGWDAWMAETLAASASGREIAFATVSQETGTALGSTRFLTLRPEHRSVEIGWTWLTPTAWRTGANTEAKLLQLAHAFETWTCRRVELKTDALNDRARGAMEAFGATFEGIHSRHMLVRAGENRDTAWYSVLDDEWPSVRARLEARLRTR